jgi:hypothetical protein
MALLSEPRRNVACCVSVVFDDEDLHPLAPFGIERLLRSCSPRHNNMAPIASGTPEAIGSTRPISTAGFKATVNAANGLATWLELQSTASPVAVAITDIAPIIRHT